MKIAIGSDHGGFHLKEHIKQYLQARDVEVLDFGTFTEESVDYPDIAEKVGRAVAAGEPKRGILICGTGIGISIAANRHSGIRAALCATELQARLSRQHNNANVIAVGGRMHPLEESISFVDAFLAEPFPGDERHQARIDLLTEYEDQHRK